MLEPRALVQNAADREQVGKAKKTEALNRLAAENDLRTVLATVEGRRWIWALLGKCKVNQSIMQTNATIYYLAGRQDLGNELMGEVIACDPELFLLMQREHYDEVRTNG